MSELEPNPVAIKPGVAESASPPVPGRYLILFLLTLITTCAVMDRAVITICVEAIRREFHLSDGQFGLASGLAFSLTFDRSSPPSVLRVYRGRARPGELHEYTAEVREGTFADDSAAHGPLALCLAHDEPDRFVTVSTWTDWDTIMAATGGSFTNPIATRHSHRLLEGTADLYEILPTTADDARPVPTS